MLITRKSPFQAELSWLQDEMNRVFGLETHNNQASFEPNVTIWEQDDKFILQMEVHSKLEVNSIVGGRYE